MHSRVSRKVEDLHNNRTNVWLNQKESFYPHAEHSIWYWKFELEKFNNIKLSFFASHMKSSLHQYVCLIDAVRLLDTLE